MSTVDDPNVYPQDDDCGQNCGQDGNRDQGDEQQPDASSQASYSQPYGQQPYVSSQVPYGQQPYAQQPCGQQPYTQQPYVQQPYASGQPPYGQPYAQQPYTYGQQPQQPFGTYQSGPYQGGYQGVPYAYQQPQAPKKKIWPWVLLACFIVLLLTIGGCVGVAACTASILENSYDDSAYYDEYDYYDGYDDGAYDSLGDGGSYHDGYTFTFDELASFMDNGEPENLVQDGACAPGVYAVGEDIKAGLYFLEGDSFSQNYCYVAERQDDSYDSYEIEYSLVFFGNYFLQLESDEVLVYDPAGSSMRACPAEQADFSPEAPYECGTYRVGTDIPAGTYTITASVAAADAAEQDCAAYVMDDLDFDEDSIVQEQYVMQGGKQTVTVRDGQYLELYATVATPAE